MVAAIEQRIERHNDLKTDAERAGRAGPYRGEVKCCGVTPMNGGVEQTVSREIVLQCNHENQSPINY